MIRILIVSYTYPPSNAPAAQRPYTLAKFLDKSKYDVTVITCSNADSSLGFDNSFNEELPDVKLLKVKSLIGAGASKFRNQTAPAKKPSLTSKLKAKVFAMLSSLVIPDKAIFWFPGIKKYVKDNNEFMNTVDVIFTTSPVFTNHLIGKYIKKKYPNIKWLVDMRDFHYVEHLEYSKGVKRYLNRKFERTTFKLSDRILFISNSMKQVYADYYEEYKLKMRVVYNGFDKEDFSDLKIEKLRSEKLSIFYAGSFYGGVRSPLPLFRLLDGAIDSKILETDEVIVNIAGSLESELLAEINKYKSSSCLNFLGKIPRSEALDLLTKSTLLWLIVSKKITHYTGVPIKMYEYMAARRPIINFAPRTSEPSAMIIDNKLGWNFDEDHETMEHQLEMFKEIVLSYREGRLNESLPANLLDKYSRKHQTNIIESIIDD